jgi:uncharacterized protein (TIGR01777 family)
MRVLITGGTGFIGRAAAHRLAVHGNDCVVLTRDPARAATLGLPPETSFIKDLSAAPHVDAVVLLAGETAAGLWTKRKRAAIVSSRVDGTRRVLEWIGASTSRPRVIVSASAVGYYGHRPRETLDETAPPDPAGGFRSRVCLSWEAEALRAQSLGVRTVVARFGIVLGRDGGLLRELLRFHRMRLSFVLGNPETSVSWVALEDATAFVERALDDIRFSGPMNVVAPTATTQKEFATAIADAVGSRVLGTVPTWVLRTALGELSSAILNDEHVVPKAALAAGFKFAETDLRAYMHRILK